MKTALTIAGSDSSGGAGIQADIKTITMNGVFAMSAITALTAQNTLGVTGVMEVTPDFLEKQIDAIFNDIRPNAVKIGMVSSTDLIKTIAKKLRQYKAVNVVVDPVMVTTSGAKLINDDAIETLKTELFPLAAIITPNVFEAEILSGISIENEENQKEAANIIWESFNVSVLCKGGHKLKNANDFLRTEENSGWIKGKWIDTVNTHGTGCTLSAAIAANIAKNFELRESVARAKDYVSSALGANLNLGSGAGPMNHAFDLRGEFAARAE